jgi:hypothetical protein
MDILQNKSMLEIASEFLNNDDEWNGDYLTSSTSALFNAFVCYKQQKQFDFDEALYLCTRNGSIDSYQTFDKSGEFKMIFFGPKDLIRELDGEGFFVWLNNLADNAEREYNLYEDEDKNEDENRNEDENEDKNEDEDYIGNK